MNFTGRLPDPADKQHGFLNFVIVGKVKKINAGWQLYVCFHFFSFGFSVGTDVLSALSDRWLGTLRSEIVQAITGSVLPATVHPAPFTLFYVSRYSLNSEQLSVAEGSGGCALLTAPVNGGGYV